MADRPDLPELPPLAPHSVDRLTRMHELLAAQEPMYAYAVSQRPSWRWVLAAALSAAAIVACSLTPWPMLGMGPWLVWLLVSFRITQREGRVEGASACGRLLLARVKELGDNYELGRAIDRAMAPAEGSDGEA